MGGRWGYGRKMVKLDTRPGGLEYVLCTESTIAVDVFFMFEFVFKHRDTTFCQTGQ